MMSAKLPVALILLSTHLFVAGGCSDPVVTPVRVEVTYLHIRPSWSPDGTLIAFTNAKSGERGIYVVDTLGGSPALVLAGDGVGITWSPDSRWLAFSRLNELQRILSTGDSLMPISSALGIRPSWSPDGSRIIYVDGGLKTVDLASGIVTVQTSYGDSPSWKTDDDVIFLTSSGPESYQLRAMKLSTKEEIVLLAVTGGITGFTTVNRPGTAVAFSVQPTDGARYSQIYAYSLQDSTISQLTIDGGDHPSWSPDGSKIVYTRPAKGDGGLWIMNSDGSGKRRLTQP